MILIPVTGDMQSSILNKINLSKALSMEEVIEAMDKERVASFVWTPVIDKQFLLEAPTREYMNRPGLTDRFNFMITTVNGEISMGAAAIRNERAFR